MSYYALTVPAEVKTRIDGGARDLPMAIIPGAREREPGQPLRLLTGKSDLCGFAIADPENELVRVFTLGDEMHQALDAPGQNTIR